MQLFLYLKISYITNYVNVRIYLKVYSHITNFNSCSKVNSKSYIELPSRFYHRHDH